MAQHKIISDGTPRGTRIVDSTGQQLENVRVIDWHLDVDSCMATARVELLNVAIDAVAEVE